MKKIFILPFLIPMAAFAVKIDANTKIQWNAIVVVAALHDVGLESHFDSNSDVALTYNRILEDLLNRKTFSATDAVSVCMQQCNKSSFLKEGRGQSGKKCPDICKGFGMALVTENNKEIKSIQLGENGYGVDPAYHPMGRIYSFDKKFYVASTKTDYTLSKDNPKFHLPCNEAVFESKSNKIVAVCDSITAEGGVSDIEFMVVEPKYKEYGFRSSCSFSMLQNDEGSCSLSVSSPESRYTFWYKKFKPCIEKLRKVNFSGIKSLLESKDVQILDKYAKDELNKLYAANNFVVQSAKFTPTSYELYNELQKNMNKGYCELVEGEKTIYEKVTRDIEKTKALFNNRKYYADFQTKSLKDAQDVISGYLNYNCPNIDTSKLKCTGDCNPLPGSQDYVSCTLGDLKATFEFDDICDKNIF